MTDHSPENPGNKDAWTLIQEGLKTARPKAEGSDERVFEMFAKWVTPIEPVGVDAKSRMLDSPEMEARFATNQLTKKRDGTTVIRYYFSGDIAEANAFCASDPLVHSECAPFRNDKTQELAREAMRSIVVESRAKIEFQEVHSAEAADITLVTAPGGLGVEVEGSTILGMAARGNNKSFIVTAMDTTQEMRMLEQVFNQLPPEQREPVKAAIRQAYDGKYGPDTNVFAILASDCQRRHFAHEIEHILGAKHPQAPGGVQVTAEGDPKTFNQSIMGSAQSGIAGIDPKALGRTLGSLDVEWYQRHFGVTDLPEGPLQAPPSLPAVKPRSKNER